jgi:multiple sugar transport system permease protein
MTANYWKNFSNRFIGSNEAIRKENLFKYAMLTPAVVTIGILMFIPLTVVIWLSFHNWSLSSLTPPEFVGLQNFIDLFKDVRFINSLNVTFWFTLISLIIEVCLGVGFALALNNNFKGQGFLRTLLLIPMLATPVAIAQIWKNLFDPTIGLLNYLLGFIGLGPYSWVYDSGSVMFALIMVDVWKWTPLITLIVLGGLSNLPAEPFESARVDGAKPLQIFVYITLPLVRPIVIIAAMFRLIDLLKSFDMIYVLSGGGPGSSSEVIYLYIYQQAFSFFNVGYSSAMIIVLFIIILIGVILLTGIRRSRRYI